MASPRFRPVELCVLACMALGLAAFGAPGASPAATAACGRGDYSLSLRVWHLKNGNVLATAGVLSDRIAPCRLATSVRIAVVSRSGAALTTVRRNGAAWQTSATLGPWSHLVHSWSWRNWCRGGRSFQVTLQTAGQRVRTRVAAPPRCVSRRSSSLLVDVGGGTRSLPPTGDRIPARLLADDPQTPFPPALIRVTNGWFVSDGRTLVAVYAGEAGDDPAVGRFGILRQDLVFGVQSEDVVDAGRSGAVRIDAAPLGTAVETSAQRGDLRFSSTGGAHGVLHLATDTLEPSS